MSTINRNESQRTYHPDLLNSLQISSTPHQPKFAPMGNEEAQEEFEQPTDVVQPGDTDEHIIEELTSLNFTPKEIEGTLLHLHAMSGIKLAGSIQRLNERMLRVILPEFSDGEIAKGLDLISYARDVRLVLESLDPSRLDAVSSLVTNRRSEAIMRSFKPAGSSNLPKRRFRITADGRQSVVEASSLQEAYRLANPTGSSVTVEEVE